MTARVLPQQKNLWSKPCSIKFAIESKTVIDKT